MSNHPYHIALIGSKNSMNDTIAEIVDSQDDLKVFTFENSQQLNASKIKPNAIIANLSTLPGKSHQILKTVKEQNDDCSIIAIHFFKDLKIINALKKEGADLYLNAEMNEDELLKAIRSVI